MLYGVSEEGYVNDPDRLLYGPGQGSTIGPFLWLLCFILIYKCLSTDAPRIHLMTVDRRMTLNYVGEAFVDDTGLGTNSTGMDNSSTSPTAPPGTCTLITNLQQLAQEWQRLLFSTGGALNLAKCFWFLLAWDWNQCRAKLHSSSMPPRDLEMTSEGDTDTTTSIKRIQAADSYRTLGVFISPSGNNTGAIKVLKDTASTYCSLLSGSKLFRQEALTSYLQYFLPKIRYQPPLLSLTKHECDKLMSPVYMSLLPKLHVNRNTARAIIHGPEDLGGLNLPNLYVIQGIDKLKLFLGHLRLQDRTGKLVHIDLCLLQLLSGSRTFCMNQDFKLFQWVETGWLQSLWAFASATNLTFTYSLQWTPPSPRENNQFIMELFQAKQMAPTRTPTIT